MNDERKTTIEVNMTDDEWIELLCLCEEINLTPEDLAVAFCQEVIRQQVDSMELRYVKELTAKREKAPPEPDTRHRFSSNCWISSSAWGSYSS